MKPLIRLPKTADIVCPELNNLIVRNHKVVRPESGILWWLLDTVGYKHWNQVLPQMISQGFRFEAVIEECIEDLRDPEKLSVIIYWINNDKNRYENQKYLSENTQTGEKIAVRFAKKLHTYENWKKLNDAFTQTGQFRITMLSQITMIKMP